MSASDVGSAAHAGQENFGTGSTAAAKNDRILYYGYVL